MKKSGEAAQEMKSLGRSSIGGFYLEHEANGPARIF